jgi:hypothetical protein
MMPTPETKKYGCSALLNAAVLVVFAGPLSVVASPVAKELHFVKSVPTIALATASLAHLEEAFWSCDHMATTQGVAASADIATCVAIYDVLKERKFGGDFDKLLSWWRQNKHAQHSRFATGHP